MQQSPYVRQVLVVPIISIHTIHAKSIHKKKARLYVYICSRFIKIFLRYINLVYCIKR